MVVQNVTVIHLTAKCIDFYTKQRVRNIDGSHEQKKEIDPRLEAIVNRMFQRCFDDRQYKQVPIK